MSDGNMARRLGYGVAVICGLGGAGFGLVLLQGNEEAAPVAWLPVLILGMCGALVGLFVGAVINFVRVASSSRSDNGEA